LFDEEFVYQEVIFGSEKYIQKSPDHYGMSGAKLVATPLTSPIHLSVTSTTLPEFEKEYMSCV